MSMSAAIQRLMLVDTEFEKILTNPILDIAARFWDEERYRAFKVCYKSMREIDDLVDHRKAAGAPLTPKEQNEFKRKIQNWLDEISNGSSANEFSRTITQFSIPVWPWQRLAIAMIYDLDHNGFKSFQTFLRYCEGAAIAPASIFIHLCGVNKRGNKYQPPNFDIRQAARALALFSYVVHILRDFEKDQRRHLNYFADDILSRMNLNNEELHKLVINRSADKRIIVLLFEYKRIAEYYQKLAHAIFQNLMPRLEPRYQLSLYIIYALYSHILEKIDPQNGIYAESQIQPSPFEVQEWIDQTVASFKPVK